MKTVYLHGLLAQQFVSSVALDVRNPTEAVAALSANFGEPFVRTIREGHYRITTGKAGKQREIGEEEHLVFNVPEGGEINIHPVVAGAGAAGRIFAGAVLLAGSFALPGGSFTFPLGAALILGGTSELLSPSVDARIQEVNDNPSFIYEGPLNLVAEGHPVPLVYGRVRVGSHVINARVDVSPAVDHFARASSEPDDPDAMYSPDEGDEDPWIVP